MLILTIIILAIVLYVFLDSKQKHHENLQEKVDVEESVLSKFQPLINHWRNKGASVGEISHTEVKMVYVIEFGPFVTHLVILLIRLNYENIKFGLTLTLILPNYKHINDASLMYKSNMPQDELIEKSQKDIIAFIQENNQNIVDAS